MKVVIIFALLFALAHATSVEELWREFKVSHGKTYKSLMEEKKRFSIFRDNVQTIEEHNEKYAKGEESFTMGINHFADMTHEEFMSLLSTLPPKPTRIPREVYNDTRTVGISTVNWVHKGLVTSVKDQGSCGSCWAFSAIGSIEGQMAKNSGKLVSLSAQNLVDCDTSINEGCNGGYMDYAFEYIQNNGICTEDDYPYKGYQQSCQKQGTLTIAGYVDIVESEEALLSALSSVGPISAGLDASSLNYYSGGIFTNNYCGSNINHGVLLVGAGSLNGRDYWLVKNSWGANWGEHGYFRLQRGVKACGVTLMNSYPKL